MADREIHRLQHGWQSQDMSETTHKVEYIIHDNLGLQWYLYSTAHIQSERSCKIILLHDTQFSVCWQKQKGLDLCEKSVG